MKKTKMTTTNKHAVTKNTSPQKHFIACQYSSLLLLGILLCVTFFLLIPFLQWYQMMPAEYYNKLPVSNDFDFDRDGIPNQIDAHPFIRGSNTKESVKISIKPIQALANDDEI